MNQAVHRPRTHLRVKAFFRQPSAQRGGEFGFHFFLEQLLFELQQKFIHHFGNNRRGERRKRNHRIKAVAEFRREKLVDRLHFIAALALIGEAHSRPAQAFRARIGGHDDNHIAKIRTFAVIVGELAVIHHLQQHIENIGVRFFDFIEQKHAIRLLVHRLGEQAALLEAHIARRRADQARHGMALHIFRHIKALQRHAERESQLPRHFGFAHAGGAGKEKAADGFVGQTQARARHFHGGHQGFDGAVLAKHHVFQIAAEILQHLLVVVRHGFFRNARHFGNHRLDLRLADYFFLLRFGQNALRRAGFIHHINGFVGQKALVDIARRQFRRCFQRRLRVAHFVKAFKHGLEAAQNLHRFGHAGLGNVDFLKTAAQRVVFVENGAVFIISSGTDAAQLPLGQRRLEQIGSIHGAARHAARADNGVDFVHKQHRIRNSGQLLQHRFHTRFEIAAVFGARQQCAHVERKHRRAFQSVRHLAVDNLMCQALGQRGFAHTGFAHQQRIIFAAAAQHLHQPLHFVLAAD